MKLLFLVVKLATAPVPGKARRRALRHAFRSFAYGWQARHRGKVGEGVVFVGPTRVNKRTSIGAYSTICGLSVSGDGPLDIGRNCEIAPDVLVLTQNHDYDDGSLIPYGTEFHEKKVVIEDFVWVGQRVTILPGTTIREGAIIQAGAVVRGEIAPFSIAGGCPARPFAQRNRERFLKLKAEGAYRGGTCAVSGGIGTGR